MSIETEALERIKKHYSTSNAPLMLSTLGKELRVDGKWPVLGDQRSMRQVVEALRPKADVIADPTSPSFLIAVDKEHEEIGHAIIAVRKEVRFLQNLPRTIAIAFVTGTANDKVYLQKQWPFKYSVNDDLGGDFVQIDADLRLPGPFFESVRELPPETIKALAQSVRSWIERNGISLEGLVSSRLSQDASNTITTAPEAGRAHAQTRNALDRLIAAQSVDVAKVINIPLDIAQILSRLP
jgi:hypothetical protein